jgi:palmitoyltransferase
MRANGFMKPWDRIQIASWIIMPLFVFHMVFIVTPALPQIWAWICGLLTVVCSLGTIVHSALAMYIDTSDLHLKTRSVPREKITSDIAETMRQSAPENTEWCFNCKWFVSSSSYHCRRCDKCSRRLDHHCSVLNNCIAEQNYYPFMLAVCFAGLFFLLVSSSSLYILIQFGATLDFLRARYGVVFPEIALGILLIPVIALSIVCTLLVWHLFFFHVYLWYKGMLTHEYLLGGKSFQTSHQPRVRVSETEMASFSSTVTVDVSFSEAKE